MNDDKARKARKGKVLHTRVPEVLEQELKALAHNLRVPVSNVVRTILEDAVNTVDVIGRRAEDEIRGVAERMGARPAGRRDDPPLAGVLGYQALRLAREEACSLCGKALERGSEAHLGIRDDGGPRVLLGPECLPFSATPQASDNQEKEDHHE